MKQIIRTDNAPQAIGPYSQAIKVTCGTMIYCSGQVSLDPKTGQVVGATAAEQCKQIMENVQGLLAASGAGLSDIVKTTIFLADLNEFANVNQVYGSYFVSDPPARSTVEVSRLPKDTKVEIEVIAMLQQ